MNGSDRTDRASDAKPTTPIRIPRRSVADQDFLNPILSGRSWVGHKPDPDRPVDTPNVMAQIINAKSIHSKVAKKNSF